MNRLSIVHRFSRAGISLVLGVLVSSASIAAADQAYALKLHVNRGDKWAFDATTSMNQKGQILANGQVAQPIEQAFSQRRKGTIEVMAIENGVPSAMRITYDRESANSGPDAKQVPPFALAGRTVNVSRKDGIVTSDLGNDVDTPTVQEVGHMLDLDTSVYPKEPVAINQEWDGDTVAAAKAYQLGPDDKMSIKCKLLEVHQVDGRQVAEVGLTGTMLKHDQGFIETRITLEGASRVDLQTGQAIESGMKGKMTMTGAQNSPGPDGAPVKITISADGDIEVRQTVKLLNVAAAAEGPGFAIGLAHPVAPQPDFLANGPGPGSPSGFAGNYKGDQVALELTDAGGQITGTLTVGNRKFPVTAKADGNNLAGKFDSDGTPFEFTASLDGVTLTLTSAGSTYTLKKPAMNPLAQPEAKNPLAQPEPKNPLAQ